jgi:hypothetical protein
VLSSDDSAGFSVTFLAFAVPCEQSPTAMPIAIATSIATATQNATQVAEYKRIIDKYKKSL